jgi:hypothetical protein
MQRFCYFGALLGLMASLSAAATAQNGTRTISLDTSPIGARVQKVVVRGTAAAMEVEIQTSGAPVTPDSQSIVSPDRIIVDFPGALPAAELRALQVNRGALKAVRAGLFFKDPPITRVVLDLQEPQSYRISTIQNAVVIKLGPAAAARTESPNVPAAPIARLQNASLGTGAKPADATVADMKITDAKIAEATPANTKPADSKITATNVSAPGSHAPAMLLPAADLSTPPPPSKPLVTVSFTNGMLRIHAEKATLAQVLSEVQRQTKAEIAIPEGAELEEVVADIGPAPARDVLGVLLNGSPYNFIFVGNEANLERVLLTRRQP